MVSPAELERLLPELGQRRRPRFFDLAELGDAVCLESDGGLSEDGGAGAARSVAPPESLPSARAPGLPWPEHAEATPKAAAPEDPASAEPGSRQDTDEPEGADGDGAAARSREPGEEFF